MKPNLGLAARTLALDLATGEVVRGMDAAGIGCMVLKGPAMAHRLSGDSHHVADRPTWWDLLSARRVA